MRERADAWRKVFEGQGVHLLVFVSLGVGLLWTASSFEVSRQRAWGYTAYEWVVVSWVFAGLMQAWIWFFWRMELYLGWVSRTFGHAGFRIFQIGFVVLPIGRFGPLIAIATATAGTSPIPRWLDLTLLAATTPPILWTFYSFARYIGVSRAMGADHFDPSYRGGELETRGIFRYVQNPAYAVGLLILYHAGWLWGSALALVAATAHHALVWGAFFCTEKPDIEEIYRDSDGDPG